jgi:hypothetical protein
MIVINLASPKAGARRKLLFNKPASEYAKQWADNFQLTMLPMFYAWV